MSGILYALVTVFAWGTWLAPSQNVHFQNQQVKIFYVATANLIITFLIIFFQGWDQVTAAIFWLPFSGGIIWALSGFCAFTATHRIGIAKAFGIWAPLNIFVGIIWGMVLFDEFLGVGTFNLMLLAVSVVIIICGILLIIFANEGGTGKSKQTLSKVGLLGAFGAGILWGTYFIPIKISAVSLWIATFPLAVGMFAGSFGLLVLSGKSPKLDKPLDYFRVSATGILWTIGNFGMLLLVDYYGAGKGFTIAQLSVVVNALVGIYILKDPTPKTRAAYLTLGGCFLAMIGGIILGNLN